MQDSLIRRAAIALVLAAGVAAPGAMASEAEAFARLAPCLHDGFRKATGPDATPETLSRMVREYFNLASVAAQKYGGRNFNRASNKDVLMAHAAEVLEREIAENLGFYAGAEELRLDADSVKEVRPAGRYQITGQVPGDEAFVIRVSEGGPRGCQIHAFFYGGLSISSLMDDRLIRY
jgi:hypothetical protein